MKHQILVNAGVTALLLMVGSIVGCARRDSQPTGVTQCSNPASVTEAVNTLANARPCASWVSAQAANFSRKAYPSFAKGVGWDPLRFTERTDHTVEFINFAEQLMNAFPVNLSAYALLSGPWASPQGVDYKFPYPADVLEERLRGMAAVALYAKSKGAVVTVSVLFGPNWETDLSFSSLDAFKTWVNSTYVPQLVEYARMAELVKAEAITPGSIEVDQFFKMVPTLRRMPAADQLAAAQYWMSMSAAGIKSVFSGRLITAVTAGYSTEAQLQTTVDPQAIVPDWTTMDYSAFDEIGVTMTVDCDGSAITNVSTQFSRVATLLANNPGKTWSVGEVLAPASGCTSFDASYDSFIASLNAQANQPVGVRFDLNAISEPAVDVPTSVKAKITAYFNTK